MNNEIERHTKQSSFFYKQLERIHLLLVAVFMILNAVLSSMYVLNLEKSILYKLRPIMVLYFIVFALFCIVRTRKELKTKLPFFLVSLSVLSISTIITGNTVLILIVCIALGCGFVDYINVIKAFFVGNLIGLLTVIFMRITNVISELDYTRINGASRISLGFVHPNTLGLYVMAIVMSIFILRRKKKNILDILFTAGAAVFCYKFPNSISATLILSLLTIFLIVNNAILFITKRNLWSFRWFRLLAIFSIIVILIGIIYIVLQPSNDSFIASFSSTFLDRFLYARTALKRYGINLFGHEITFYGSSYFKTATHITHEYFAIDAGYVLILVRDGLFPFMLLMYLVVLTIKNAIKLQEKEFLTVIFLLLIYSIVESQFFDNCALAFGYVLAFAKRPSMFKNKKRKKRIRIRSLS